MGTYYLTECDRLRGRIGSLERELSEERRRSAGLVSELEQLRRTVQGSCAALEVGVDAARLDQAGR